MTDQSSSSWGGRKLMPETGFLCGRAPMPVMEQGLLAEWRCRSFGTQAATVLVFPDLRRHDRSGPLVRRVQERLRLGWALWMAGSGCCDYPFQVRRVPKWCCPWAWVADLFVADGRGGTARPGWSSCAGEASGRKWWSSAPCASSLSSSCHIRGRPSCRRSETTRKGGWRAVLESCWFHRHIRVVVVVG